MTKQNIALKTFVPSIFLERFCILEKGLDMTYCTVFIVSGSRSSNSNRDYYQKLQ